MTNMSAPVKYLNVGSWSFPSRGLVVLLGSTIILVGASVDYSYGNLNTYVTSYLRWKNPSISYADWVFVSQSKTILGGALAPFGGEISRRLGIKLSLIIGSIIYTGGYLLTYFSLNWGLWAVVVTMGVSHGIGYALTYTPAVSSVMKWFPSKRGTFGSIAIAGYGFGSVIWNPLETAFVNPDNIKAQPSVDDPEGDKYFVNEDVLNRVPTMFLMIGGIIGVLQILSILVIRDPSDEEEKELLKSMEVDMEDLVEKEDKSMHSVKPKKAVKTWVFWMVFWSFFSMNLLTQFLSNYQKAFGLKFIDDDKFLSVASSLQNVMNGASRIVWGIIYDRMGYKFSLMIIACVSTAFASSFGCIALIEPNTVWSKIFFAVWTCGVYTFNPGAYSCFPAQIMKAFGPKYNSTIYGLIMTSSIVCSIVVLTVTQSLFEFIGFTGMFLIAGVIGVLTIVLTLLFNESPHKPSEASPTGKDQDIDDEKGS